VSVDELCELMWYGVLLIVLNLGLLLPSTLRSTGPVAGGGVGCLSAVGGGGVSAGELCGMEWHGVVW
jgi:hypothetical protein